MTTKDTKKDKKQELCHHVGVHQHTKEDKIRIYSKCYQVILYVYPQFPLSYIRDFIKKNTIFAFI